MRRFRQQSGPHRRRGTLLPAIVIAIAVVGLCGALVFDRLWLDAARIELRTAAEAAAFAAAGRLVTDDRLRADGDILAHIDDARRTAVAVAAANRVAGSPVRLDPSIGTDIRFGRVTDDPFTGRAVFLETDYDPTTVLVTARADRSRGNGVALFFRRLTGVPAGNALGRAGVTIDNCVIGVRPLSGVPVPALPLGILEADPLSDREDTWDRQITQHAGPDQFGFDESVRRITDGPDGIPEITLVASRAEAASASPISAGIGRSYGTDTGSRADENTEASASSNACIIDVGTGLFDPHVRRQMAAGWSPDDLASFDGQLRIDGSAGLVVGSAEMLVEMIDDFGPLVGQPRICVLYREESPADASGIARLSITQLVAGRILSIENAKDSVRIVFQPAVITTPTAILADANEFIAPNPYISKLHLTH